METRNGFYFNFRFIGVTAVTPDLNRTNDNPG